MFRILSNIWIILALFFFSFAVKTSAQNSYDLISPDGNVKVSIQVNDVIQYTVQFHGEQILRPSNISLSIQERGTLGQGDQVHYIDRVEVDEVLHPVVQQKSSEIHNHYKELSIYFNSNYSVIFRAYNDGIAYRFETDFDDDKIKVTSEQLQFNFDGNYNIYFPEEESFITHQERGYKYLKLKDISSDQFSSTPALVDINKGPNVLITEADLQ